MFSNKIAQYAKFIAAVIGALVTAGTDSFGTLPAWVSFVAASVTAIAVLMIPNVSANQPDVPRSINDRTD